MTGVGNRNSSTVTGKRKRKGDLFPDQATWDDNLPTGPDYIFSQSPDHDNDILTWKDIKFKYKWGWKQGNGSTTSNWIYFRPDVQCFRNKHDGLTWKEIKKYGTLGDHYFFHEKDAVSYFAAHLEGWQDARWNEDGKMALHGAAPTEG